MNITQYIASMIAPLPVWVQMLAWLAVLVVGFVLLIKGADIFVDGASALARKFGIPSLIIGLTIVAMGTSLPEAAVSITSAFKGSADIAVGNVLGSNIMNILLILGLTSVVRALPVGKNTARIEIPFVLAVTAIMFAIGFFDRKLSRIDGAILWVLFIAYLVYLGLSVKNNHEESSESEDKKFPVWKMLLYIPLGAAMIVIGSDFSVDAASAMARQLGVTERIIGLTIVALGTSLPELVTSVTAAKKGETDIAVGNIVGSNIFNILFVLGTAALFTPVPYAESFLIDSVAAMFAVLLLFFCVLPNRKLGRAGGIVMLACYAAYCIHLFI